MNNLADKRNSGADPEFFKGGGLFLGIAESIGNAPEMLQFENWNLTENCHTRNTSNVTK